MLLCQGVLVFWASLCVYVEELIRNLCWCTASCNFVVQVVAGVLVRVPVPFGGGRCICMGLLTMVEVLPASLWWCT